MIFRELILQNFGLYYGQQALQFTPEANPSSSKKTPPIVLIGGWNGCGKTTLIDAIRLALYGQRSQCSTRNNLNYRDFLKQSIHRHVREGESAFVELAFQETLNNQPKEFRVRRTWDHDLKSGKDTLELSVDGVPDKAWTESWDERIEDILPLGISNLFLFDGEQIKELAEQNVLPSSVINAIQTLLGLELPKILSNDLTVLTNRKLKEAGQNSEIKDLETLEKELEEKQKECDAAEQDLSSINVRLIRARKRQDDAQEQFIVQGGKLTGEQDRLTIMLDQMQSESESQQQTLKDLAASSLPLNLIQNLLEQAREQGQEEIQNQRYSIAKELLLEQNNELSNLIDQLSLPAKKAEKLQVFLAEKLLKLEAINSADASWLGIDEKALGQLERVLKVVFPSIDKSAQQALAKFREVRATIDSIEERLAMAASEETYKNLVDAVKAAQSEVVALSVAHEKAKATAESRGRERNLLKKQLVEYAEEMISRNNDQHFLETVVKVQETLAVFREKLKLKKLKKLEEEITKRFLELARKSDLVGQITINAETFSLTLHDADGQTLQKYRLSAGEKQLLAIALLWGLIGASGRQLPIVIDTPLGRLDSSHRKNLIDTYFPKASHQVILLSTDTEVGEVDVTRLRKKKLIASEYLLKFNSKQSKTLVTPGYFW